MYSRNTCRLTLAQLFSKSIKVRKVNTAGSGEKILSGNLTWNDYNVMSLYLFESIEIIKLITYMYA